MESLAVQSAPSLKAMPVETGWLLSGCMQPGAPISQIPIDADKFVIGRRPGTHLQLNSMRVSGKHAEVRMVGSHLFIRDLGSTNGTFVNRIKVSRLTPIGPGDHIEIADMEFKVVYDPPRPISAHDSDGLCRKTVQELDTFEPEWVLTQFDRLVHERAVTPHFQPIVTMTTARVVGYEALARSTMPGLDNPRSMFEAARLVNREAELSMLCRQRAVELAQWLPERMAVFVNTHPLERLEVDVLTSLKALRRRAPDVHMVVEIHEAAIDDLTAMREFDAAIRDLGISLAYDDFGAGRSRLVELVQVPPTFLKFDSCLLRDIDRASSQHHKLVRMLVEIAKESSTHVLAEGVETRAEVEVCRELGFDYAQGYFFGRPAPLTSVGGPDTCLLRQRQAQNPAPGQIL